MIRFCSDPTDKENVIDISLSGEYPFRMLSFDYQHGGIPVPGLSGMYAESVTGAFEGLRLISRRGLPGKVNFGFFVGPGRERKPRPNQWCTGFSYRGRCLGLAEARRLILIPAYLWVLTNKAIKAVAKLERLCDDAWLYDGHESQDIRAEDRLSSAAVLVAHLNHRLDDLYAGSVINPH